MYYKEVKFVLIKLFVQGTGSTLIYTCISMFPFALTWALTHVCTLTHILQHYQYQISLISCTIFYGSLLPDVGVFIHAVNPIKEISEIIHTS